MKRKKTQYQVKTPSEYFLVNGWKYASFPGLAVNHPIRVTDSIVTIKKGWNITHIASGVAINRSPFNTLAECISFLEEVFRKVSFDWEKPIVEFGEYDLLEKIMEDFVKQTGV